jgi:pimeloyl-ACP methyl ester carboxylesterase
MLSPITALLPLLVSGAIASPVARDSSGPTIQWGSCGNNSQIPAQLECGQLVVPLDHNNPPSPDQYNANNTLTLGMSRLRTPGSNSSESLIINPGGPGGVAWVTLLLQLQAEAAGAERGIVSKAVREKYDLIGLDPRGVGLGQPIKCDDSMLKDRPDIVIDSQDDWDKLEAWNRMYGQSCQAMSGDLLGYVDTVSVAKDFELFRQASPHPRRVLMEHLTI